MLILSFRGFKYFIDLVLHPFVLLNSQVDRVDQSSALFIVSALYVLVLFLRIESLFESIWSCLIFAVFCFFSMIIYYSH